MSVGIAVAVAIAVAITAAAAAAHAHAITVAAESAVAGSTRRYMTGGEVRSRTDVLLTFGTRKRCPDQRAVHRPVDDGASSGASDLVCTCHCDLRRAELLGSDP